MSKQPMWSLSEIESVVKEAIERGYWITFKGIAEALGDVNRASPIGNVLKAAPAYEPWMAAIIRAPRGGEFYAVSPVYAAGDFHDARIDMDDSGLPYLDKRVNPNGSDVVLILDPEDVIDVDQKLSRAVQLKVTQVSDSQDIRRRRDYISQEIQDVYVFTASTSDGAFDDWIEYESSWAEIEPGPERSASFELTWSVSGSTGMSRGDYFVMLSSEGSQAGIIGYGWVHEIERADDETLVDLRLWSITKDALVPLRDLQAFFPGIVWPTLDATAPLPQLAAEQLILELDRRTFGKLPEAKTNLTTEEHEVTVESVERIAKARKGQDKFRALLVNRAHHNGLAPECEVCGFDDLILLDAAHIKGHADGGKSDWDNGALLCATHHRAMDRGYFVLTGDWPNRLPHYAQGYKPFRTSY